jgi:DNA-binding CsgD family transcriptional regulator
MHSKNTSIVSPPQHFIYNIPAGMLQNDATTELFSDRVTKKLYAISKGITIPFNEIDNVKKALIFEKLLSDDVAMNDLKHLSQSEAIERYAYCMYGSLDSVPDFKANGELNDSDNFICGNDCTCIHWKTKKITVNGKTLTPHKLQILNFLASDFCDKQIADKLDIAQSTLNTHKAQLFETFEVYSKMGLIMKAIEFKIIQ